MTKTLCIYHANCADGLGAAWAVHRALDDQVKFVAASYGDDTDENSNFADLRDRDILIVDFSYPLATLRAMAAEARSVLVLDHHKTAQDDLKQVPPLTEMGVSASGGVPATVQSFWENAGRMKTEHNIHYLAAVFDLNRSGAGLAWDYLNPSTPRPRVIDLIEDRDLWRFKFSDETCAFHAVLTSYDIADLSAMFELLDYLEYIRDDGRGLFYQQTWRALTSEGHAILRAQQQAVASAVHTTRRTMRIAGHVVPAANVPAAMASDAGHLLCQTYTIEQAILAEINLGDLKYDREGLGRIEDAVEGAVVQGDHAPPFCATYYDGTDGRRHFSLRSPEGGADVGAIAKQMAAGLNNSDPLPGRAFYGHEHAAGFDAPLGWEGE